MNLTIQKVAHSAELDRELAAAIGESSPIKALQGAVDSFRELPDAFDSLRRAINEACRTVKEQLKSFEDFNRTFGTTMGVGVAERIKAAGYAPGQIEIDASFARMIGHGRRRSQTIGRRKYYIQRRGWPHARSGTR